MAIIPVKKVSAIVHKKDARAVLKKLQETGVMEISRTKLTEELTTWQENAANIARLDVELADVRGALEVIRRYDHSKKSMLTPKPEIALAALKDQSENRQAVAQAVAMAQDIAQQMNVIRQRYSRTVNQIAQIKPFERLDVPMRDLKHTRHTKMLLGSAPKEAVEAIDAIVAASDGMLFVEYLGEPAELTPLLAIVHAEAEPEVRAQFKENGFADMRLENFAGTPAERLAELERELDGLEEERKAQEARAEEAAAYKLLLLGYEDYLQNQLARERAFADLGATASVNVLEGYIRARDEHTLDEAVKSVTDTYYLSVTEPSEDDDVPTVIENKRLLRPFEAVTDMYSTPAYRGIDPVYILAPFYFIFFGAMLSDAAYGILLTIGALLVLKLKKPDGMFRKVTTVLAICGISTLIWGALFGSWMGFSLTPLWFNPLEEPMTMLITCIAIGYLHLLVALFTGLYMSIRDGKVLDGLFDKGFWILILLAIPLFVFGSMLEGMAVLATVGTICALAGAAGLVLTQGRHKKGIVKKFIGGLASLYDVTGYLSDLLSYARIFGMALATGVIGMVFNTIVGMLWGNIFGYVLAAAVFAVGHIFNLGINALGAYVHSARLQYIESFNKFFEAGGRAFKPLAYRTKNMRVAAPGAMRLEK